MERPSGTIWEWRRRVAYRLLARSERVSWDDASGEAGPVRLDFPDHDIWIRATFPAERKWRARACAKEPWTVRWLMEHVGRGEVLYDIGANVGTFSLIAAVARGASVVAFEPAYGTFARLCENIQLNSCDEAIVPVPLPLSDVVGLDRFAYRSLEPGQSRHVLGPTHDSVPYAQPVCTITLDRAVSEFRLPAPQHLKIDVDGAELRLLRGAAAVLRGPQLRTVLIESDANAWEPVASELAAAGLSLETRHERPEKRGAPLYALWTRRG